jgi:hypothetical protein
MADCLLSRHPFILQADKQVPLSACLSTFLRKEGSPLPDLTGTAVAGLIPAGLAMETEQGAPEMSRLRTK